MTDENEMRVQCVLRDGRFVEPCWALAETLESDFGRGTRAQGLKTISLINLTTRKPSRSYAAVKSGKHSKRGLALNYCPFCGADINTFAEEMDAIDADAKVAVPAAA